MLIIGIRGGLGNQLFQVAYAAYCLEQGQDVAITDLNKFYSNKHSDRDVFSLGIVSELSIPMVEPCRARFYLSRMMGKLSTFFSGLYNLGYFQDTKFVDSKVLNVFRSKILVPINKKYEIVLHIRGGDYLTPKNATMYNVIDYQAISELVSQLGGKITVITNDENYAHKILNDFSIDAKIFRGTTELEELAIFSSAEIRIGSNSTFSLWGHLLSDSGKSFFPKKWSSLEFTPYHSFGAGVETYG